jgi:hypothetical protein
MPTLKDYRATFYEFTGKASDISRQLAFAGIALIWIFKSERTGSFAIPQDLVRPGILIIASLALDLVQYCIASVTWFFFYRTKELAYIGEDEDLTHSPLLEVPMHMIFWGKIGCILTAYYMLFRYLLKVLTFT